MAFNDIQSDYYQIPSEDKEKIRIAEEKIREDLKDKATEINQDNSQPEVNSENNGDKSVEINFQVDKENKKRVSR